MEVAVDYLFFGQKKSWAIYSSLRTRRRFYFSKAFDI